MNNALEQADYRMPATGEAWRQNTTDYPSLFTIIGMAHDEVSGAAVVVYTHYEWALAQLPPIFTCPLAEFLAFIPAGRGSHQGPRFRFDREAESDPKCPFIRRTYPYPMRRRDAETEYGPNAVPYVDGAH